MERTTLSRPSSLVIPASAEKTWANRIPFAYTQNTDFTCGPTVLRAAMDRLLPDRVATPGEDMEIWRDANSTYMGEGEPGCTHFGLAVAALRRGFTASLCTNRPDVLDGMMRDLVAEPWQEKFFDAQYRAHRQEAYGRGLGRASGLLAGEFNLDLIRTLQAQGQQLLMVTRSFCDDDEHWVMIDDVKEDGISLIDPCHESRRAQYYRAAHHKPFHDAGNLKDRSLFGPDHRVHCVLAIGRAPQ